jgi:hypothetical protein
VPLKPEKCSKCGETKFPHLRLFIFVGEKEAETFVCKGCFENLKKFFNSGVGSMLAGSIPPEWREVING